MSNRVQCLRISISRKDNNQSDLDELNSQIAIELQNSGDVVFSTTKINGKTGLRAAIVNHRTVMSDIELSVRLAIEMGNRLSAA